MVFVSSGGATGSPDIVTAMSTLITNTEFPKIDIDHTDIAAVILTRLALVNDRSIVVSPPDEVVIVRFLPPLVFRAVTSCRKCCSRTYNH